MNDFIDLPHLPECLLGLPLETIHEIHSHTYHAIKADRQCRGEPGNGCECNQGQSCQVCDPVEGWQLVPKKPTHEMIAAMRDAIAYDQETTGSVYAVMLEAAPKFGEEQ